MTSARENAAIHAKAIAEDRTTVDQLRETFKVEESVERTTPRTNIGALVRIGCTIDPITVFGPKPPIEPDKRRPVRSVVRLGLVRFDGIQAGIGRYAIINENGDILCGNPTATACLRWVLLQNGVDSIRHHDGEEGSDC